MPLEKTQQGVTSDSVSRGILRKMMDVFIMLASKWSEGPRNSSNFWFFKKIKLTKLHRKVFKKSVKPSSNVRLFFSFYVLKSPWYPNHLSNLCKTPKNLLIFILLRILFHNYYAVIPFILPRTLFFQLLCFILEKIILFLSPFWNDWPSALIFLPEILIFAFIYFW